MRRLGLVAVVLMLAGSAPLARAGEYSQGVFVQRWLVAENSYSVDGQWQYSRVVAYFSESALEAEADPDGVCVDVLAAGDWSSGCAAGADVSIEFEPLTQSYLVTATVYEEPGSGDSPLVVGAVFSNLRDGSEDAPIWLEHDSGVRPSAPSWRTNSYVVQSQQADARASITRDDAVVASLPGPGGNIARVDSVLAVQLLVEP